MKHTTKKNKFFLFSENRLKRPEMPVLLSAGVLTFMFAGYLLNVLRSDIFLFQKYGSFVITEIFFGRAAAISLGYNLKFPSSTVVSLALAAETILVFWAYPVMVMSLRKLEAFGPFQKAFMFVHQKSQEHKRTIARYGVWGLMIFVIIPIWMTGPVVGVLVGHLMGFSSLKTVLSVLAATYIAVGLWSFLILRIHHILEMFHPMAPVLFLTLVVLSIVSGILLRGFIKTNVRKKESDLKKDFQK